MMAWSSRAVMIPSLPLSNTLKTATRSFSTSEWPTLARATLARAPRTLPIAPVRARWSSLLAAQTPYALCVLLSSRAAAPACRRHIAVLPALLASRAPPPCYSVDFASFKSLDEHQLSMEVCEHLSQSFALLHPADRAFPAQAAAQAVPGEPAHVGRRTGEMDHMMFGALDELLSKTSTSPSQIDFLICGSDSSHFHKLRGGSASSDQENAYARNFGRPKIGETTGAKSSLEVRSYHPDMERAKVHVAKTKGGIMELEVLQEQWSNTKRRLDELVLAKRSLLNF